MQVICMLVYFYNLSDQELLFITALGGGRLMMRVGWCLRFFFSFTNNLTDRGCYSLGQILYCVW